MRDRSVVGRDRAARIALVPVSAVRRQLDLAQDEVDDPVQEVVLVRDVVVERHRLDAERLAELPHRQRLDPALVGERDGGVAGPALG